MHNFIFIVCFRWQTAGIILEKGRREKRMDGRTESRKDGGRKEGKAGKKKGRKEGKMNGWKDGGRKERNQDK